MLTPLESLHVADRDELRDMLRPGVDGLVITAGSNRGTFLPSVWEQLPEPDDFLDQLWAKAGLKRRSWPEGLVVERYGTVEFG